MPIAIGKVNAEKVVFSNCTFKILADLLEGVSLSGLLAFLRLPKKCDRSALIKPMIKHRHMRRAVAPEPVGIYALSGIDCLDGRSELV